MLRQDAPRNPGEDTAVTAEDQVLPLVTTVELPDGARFPVRGLRQPTASAPAVVVVPAMGTPARYYRAFAQCLHVEGLTALTVDLRGQGESAPRVTRRSRFGYREIVEHDLTAVLCAVREALPQAPLFIVGHSLGGHLSLIHAGLGAHPGPGPGVDGIALVASGSPWFKVFGRGRGLKLLLAEQVMVAVATVMGYWPGHRLGFGGRQPTRLIRDWARQARTGRFSAEGSRADYESALCSLQLPVLAVTVHNDELAPPASVDHLTGKLHRAQVTRWHYTAEAAGGGPLDHFRWTRSGGGLARHIAEWARTAVASRTH
jgi:predicted alpha/beta hydrolase